MRRLFCLNLKPPLSYSVAHRKLKRYQAWRHGLVDDWSKNDRIPPGEELDDILNTALDALKKGAHSHG